MSFSRDFPNAKVIKLERNYRSTQNILDAAGAVVANNPDRLGKTLSAENGAGLNLKYFEGRDAFAEAEFVAGELTKILEDDSSLTCAVEYRTNFQSRAFEEVFRRRGIRYKLRRRLQLLQSRGSERHTRLRAPGAASRRRHLSSPSFKRSAARHRQDHHGLPARNRDAPTTHRSGTPSTNSSPANPAAARRSAAPRISGNDREAPGELLK